MKSGIYKLNDTTQGKHSEASTSGIENTKYAKHLMEHNQKMYLQRKTSVQLKSSTGYIRAYGARATNPQIINQQYKLNLNAACNYFSL